MGLQASYTQSYTNYICVLQNFKNFVWFIIAVKVPLNEGAKVRIFYNFHPPIQAITDPKTQDFKKVRFALSFEYYIHGLHFSFYVLGFL